jgi:hypothetical protein
MKIIWVLLLVVVATLVLAIRFLPWQAVVGGIVVLILAGYLFSGRILEALFKIPFRAKGAVLRGATAEIHSLTGVAKPEAKSEDGEEEEDANRRYYLLDVTIKPVARSGNGFQLWEPGELLLVSLDAKAEDTDADGDLCEIKRIEIEGEGGFVADEGMKYGGPQRLRLTLSAAPEARQFQFRYYFELFGNVSLLVQQSQTTGARGLFTA